MDREKRLAECFRRLEETGSAERCLALDPELQKDLEERLPILRALSGTAEPFPPAGSESRSRRLQLTSVTSSPVGQSVFGRLITSRAGASLAALILLVASAVGAGAAGGGNVPGPVGDVLNMVGIENHGSAVSDAVHKAIESTIPGLGRGKAVSEAACQAAHDRLDSGGAGCPGSSG